jgi:hypothetical protein
MPGGNRKGPMGMGPRTGRRAGYCGGANAPGFAGRMGVAILMGGGPAMTYSTFVMQAIEDFAPKV